MFLIFAWCGAAHAGNELEQWRSKADEIRQLAENDIPAAYARAQHLQAELPADATPADRTKALNVLARTELYLGLTDLTDRHVQQAFELAKQQNDRVGQAEADLIIAMNAVNEARIDKMNAAVMHSMDILDGVDRPDLLGESMLRTSMMYRRMDEVEDSVSVAMQAMEIARRNGDTLALAYAYQGLAAAYDLSEHNEKARDYYLRMREQARITGYGLLETDALLGAGGLTIKMGHVDEGLGMIRDAIDKYRTIGGPFYVAHAQYMLANALDTNGHPEQALPILSEVADLYRQGANKIGLWWALKKRSITYQALGKIAEADSDAEQSYRLAREIGFPLYLHESRKQMAAIAAARDKHKHAYQLLAEANEMASKDTRNKANRRMVDLAQRYQSESKQREIDTLNRSNQQQASKLERQALRQRWLWTVLVGSVIMLAGASFFLVRLRHSHLRLEMLNAEVLQAKNKLQATLDTIPDLLFELGLDGHYHDYHSPRTDLLTAPAEYLLGKTVPQVMPADAAAIVMSALREAHEHGFSTGRQFEFALPHGDFWFELSVASKPVADGEEPRFIALSRDITERKHLEAQALQREQEFRVLVENSPDLIFRYDKDCRRIYTNPAVAKLTGKPSDSLLNMTSSEAKILSADEAGKLMQMIRQVLSSGQPAESEVACLCADGQLHYFHNRYAPEFNAHGEVVGVISIARDITERKQMDEALNMSRQILTEAQRIARLGSWELDLETNRLSWTDEIFRIFEIDPQEFGASYDAFIAMVHPDDQNAVDTAYIESLKNREPYEIEHRLQMADGRIKYVLERCETDYDDEGKPLRSLGTVQDISDRKQAENALAAREREFRTLAESLPDNIVRYDREGRTTYVNPVLEKTLGTAAENMIGTKIRELFPNGEYDDYAQLLDSVLADGNNSELEKIVPNPDGSSHIVHNIRIVAEHGDNGEIIGALAIGRDITERKRAEAEIRILNADLERRVLERTEELRQQTRYLRTLIDTLPMMAWLKDKDNRFLVANQATALACDHSLEDLVGKTDLDLWPRAFAENYQAYDEEVMATRQRKTAEELFFDRRAGNIWVETLKAPVIDEDGSILGTVGVSRDISDRKAMEQARESALAEAERLAQLRSQFMARMSHELRTPLNGIMGYAQILLGENRNNERHRAMLNVIQQSGEYLLNLINEILDFAKIEAGKQELSLSNIQLRRFLRNLAGIITIKAEQKGLAFVCDIAADVPAGIRADETRLRQVLLNLLTNAIRYSEQGQVSLKVTVLGSGRLRFEVQDNGLGIDSEHLETIFQAFEQTGNSHYHIDGTGLGLPISRELARLMGSDIHVISRVGMGSTFWFDLDVPVVEVSEDIIVAEQHIAGYQGLCRRVLVVDDINENRTLLIDILSRLGFETFEATNGKACLDNVEIQKPDLILLDMVMPEMDGLETARRLRQLPNLGQTPIIAVSASASGADVTEAMKAGVNVFLSKPIDIKSLITQIAILLKLDWIYTPPETEPAPQHRADEPLLVPPLEEMTILHRLAQEGSMRDIIRQAAHLAELDPRYHPFATRIRALAQGYQSKAVLDLVERFINRL